jgi:metallo-beta-lactamase family protein
MKIQFIGAAQTVTGSMHLLEVNGYKFLLDCGLYQGKRKLAFEINRTFDLFEPAEIDFVILSHAHIDHSGNLPTLVRKGFKGKIYSTFATRDLASVMLRDSAHIQEKDVEYVNKKRKKQGKNLFEPLYTQEDAENAMQHFVGINYHHGFEIAEGIKLTFADAGHILGSAITFLELKEDGKIINLGFTGDLGRPNMPILKDPEKIPDVDYMICESTYGNKLHEDPANTKQIMIDVIKKAAARKSKIIIPAFSVGRTQELVYEFHKIFENGEAPRIPVYVDSPLSVNATEVFRLHPECFDSGTMEFILKHEDPFGFNRLTYITDVEESKKLNGIKGPMIIISSSGMCEAGRIQHHLANNIENPENIVLIVGYSAQNTLGRKIMDGEEKVKIFGEWYEVNAEVVVLNSFSAHADYKEMLDYLNQYDKERIQNFFLVHGDPEAQEPFKERLISHGFNHVTIPRRGDVFEI